MCKIPQNSVEILSNTCLYSNFETCLSYWGYLLAVNAPIYVKTSMLVWSVQNRSLSNEICPENNHKICRFFTDCFMAKFAQKIPAKLADSSAILSLKIPRNLTFFPRLIRSPVKLRSFSKNGSLPDYTPWIFLRSVLSPFNN